jgi:hypothetical protein
MLVRQPDRTEITAHTWPKVQPESGHVPWSEMLAHMLGRSATRGRVWVGSDGRRVDAAIVARARSSGMVWDVDHLHVMGWHADRSTELLERACTAAAGAGARRVFIEVPAGGNGDDIARRAGFERYTGTLLFRLSPPFKAPEGDRIDGRPRLRADEQALFQLYTSVVPAVVRSAEAMSAEEWSALHRGKKRWAPSLFGDRHQYVWELGAGLAGWFEVMYGAKSQYLEFMIDSKYETLISRFLNYALQQVSMKAPVYCAVREYQEHLAAALERAGFSLSGRFDIYVRQLAVRMPERSLMPAGILGG